MTSFNLRRPDDSLQGNTPKHIMRHTVKRGKEGYVHEKPHSLRSVNHTLTVADPGGGGARGPCPPSPC